MTEYLIKKSTDLKWKIEKLERDIRALEGKTGNVCIQNEATGTFCKRKHLIPAAYTLLKQEMNGIIEDYIKEKEHGKETKEEVPTNG